MGEARQEGNDLQRWGRVVRRHKWLLLATVVLIPAAVYGASRVLPKTYESHSTLHIQATSTGATLFSTVHTNASNAEETATLAKTTLVGRRAARILGEPPATARALIGKIQVNPATPGETKGSFLTIAAGDPNPKRAAEIANAFARAIVRVRTGSAIHSIDRTLTTLRKARRSLEEQGNKEDRATEEELASQLQQLRGLKASQAGTTTIVERAVPAASPSSPKPLRNTLLALLVAVLLAAALVPLLDRLDRRVRDSEELEELIEAPLLATVPDAAFPGHAPDWHVREAFQTLRAGLTYFNVDRPLSTLVVSSPAQWDGKTTVAVNLAVAYALDGKDVILVDADLRRPQVASRLGVQPEVGLEAVLAGEGALEEALIEIDAGGGRMRILPGATPPPNPAALLGSQRMRSLLVELVGKADMVVIDTPALLAVSDAMPLVNQAAGTVLVARLNQTSRDAVRRAGQIVAGAGGALLGTVATGARAADEYGYYGYYSYSKNGAGEGDAAAANGAGGPAADVAPPAASPQADTPAQGPGPGQAAP